MAEADAKSYAGVNDFEFLNFCQSYAMVDEVAASGIEVYSLLRDSALGPDEYVRHYFASGAERERDV